jgi:hypothetical protein
MVQIDQSGLFRRYMRKEGSQIGRNSALANAALLAGNQNFEWCAHECALKYKYTEVFDLYDSGG